MVTRLDGASIGESESVTKTEADLIRLAKHIPTMQRGEQVLKGGIAPSGWVRVVWGLQRNLALPWVMDMLFKDPSYGGRKEETELDGTQKLAKGPILLEGKESMERVSDHEAQIGWWKGQLSAMADAVPYEIDDLTMGALKNTDNTLVDVPHLPFPRVFLDAVFAIGKKVYAGVLVEQNTVIAYRIDGYSLGCGSVTDITVSDISNSSEQYKVLKGAQDEKRELRNLVANFIALVNNRSDVTIVYHERGEKNQSRRRKQGKPIMPSSYVVRLKPNVIRYIYGNETRHHTSPSIQFWVRGHWRRFLSEVYTASGKIGSQTWIRPYVKGHGILVGKTYEIRAKDMLASLKSMVSPEIFAAVAQEAMDAVERETRLESDIRMALDSLAVKYERQRAVRGMQGKRDFVIRLPDGRTLIVEADGCFWHGCKLCGYDKTSHGQEFRNRTLERDYRLQNAGHLLIVVQEHETNRRHYLYQKLTEAGGRIVIESPLS